ncbi:MAG: hypothetical protein JXA69_18170, partial [Phycisphaerae bacterium]|nr:hypothetical protein [Phycisphaerae bacterium]
NGKWRGLYAHWGRHHRQAYGDADYAKKANLEAWTALFPRYTVCSYYAAASHQPFNSPPFLHAIAGDTKYLVERGASGHLTLQYPHGYWWNFSFNLAAAAQHAYYYPARGPQEQLQDYANSYFGPAAGAVVADYLARLGGNERLEASYRASRGDAEAEHMTRLRKLHNRLRPAVKRAAGEPVYAYRVSKLTGTMEFLLHLGPIRAKVHAVEAAAKEYEAGTATRAEVEGAIAEARADIVEIQAHADRLEATLPGVMDANWLKGWTLNRTCAEPLNRIEKQLNSAATQPAGKE